MDARLFSVGLDIDQVPLEADGVDRLLQELGYNSIIERLRVRSMVLRHTRSGSSQRPLADPDALGADEEIVLIFELEEKLQERLEEELEEKIEEKLEEKRRGEEKRRS